MTVTSSRWLMSPGSSSLRVVAQVTEAAEAMGSDCVVFEDTDDCRERAEAGIGLT